MIHSPDTNMAPENRPKPTRKGLSSNHSFSGIKSLLVSGRAGPDQPDKLAVNVLLPTRAPSEIRLVLL